MEFGAATATLSKKLSNGYGVSGRSAYDGVFAAPIKLRAQSFSCTLEDYCEIFGGAGTSSIPILELPELNERNKIDEVRRSKLDYSKVFGGFGNLETAMPFEEHNAEPKPKQKDSFSNGASTRSKAKGGKHSCREGPTNFSKEFPMESQSSNDSKRINMSYHKVNQGSENGTNGTTHIAPLHAVPVYTCLIEEVNPMKVNRPNKSIPVAQNAYSGSHCNEGIKEGGHCTKSFTGPTPDNAKKQSSNNGVKVGNGSDSIDLFFDACEINNGSNGAHHIKVPLSETMVGNLDNDNGDVMRSMATKSQVFKRDRSEGAAGEKQSSNSGVKVKNRSDSVDMFFDACEDSNGSNGTHHVKVPVSETMVGNLYNRSGDAMRSMATKSQASKSDRSEGAAGEKQSSNSGVKVKGRSDSVDMFFDACGDSNGSNGTHDIKVPPPKTMEGSLYNHNGDHMRSMASECQASKSDRSEGAAGAESPSYLDDMVDSNSEAAASVAALRKAIEEAQVRMKVAKESMRRKKEGFPDQMKRKSNIHLKAEGKKEDKIEYKTMKVEKINTRQTFGQMGALPQVSSEVGKPTMIIEQVRSDLVAKEKFIAGEAIREALKAEHKEEVEQREADDNAKVPELKEVEHKKKDLYIKIIGRNAFEKLEECDHTIEVVKEYWGQENNEENVHAANEAGSCEEHFDETRCRCQAVVDETKLVQTILDDGTTDKRLEVNEDEEVENKVTPSHEPEDCESNLGRQELVIGSENKVACEPEEDVQKIEGSFELEECERNLRGIQELREGEKNIAQERKGSEERVEVSSELEECELTEVLEPTDNERACNLLGSDLKSLEGEIENLGCLEDRKRGNKACFHDVNQETKHSCYREGTQNMFSNIYVQEMLEEIMDHIQDEEEIYSRITKDSELDGNEKVQDAKVSEDEVEGATHLMEENERVRKDDKEPVDVIRMTQMDSNYEEITAEEAGETTETSSSYEPDEAEKLSKTQVFDTTVENDETPEVTPEVYSPDVQDDITVASDASFEHQEKYDEPESVQETNDFCEKHAVQTSDFIQGALEPNEAVNQTQNTSETVTFEGAATNIIETDIKVRQNQDQCLEKAENDFNLTMIIEETTPESVEICKDAREARVALNEEIDENRSNSSNEENLFDNELKTAASQVPIMSERKSSPFKEEEVKTVNSNLEESHQAAIMMEEKESNGDSMKVDLEKEHLTKIDEAKEREREREKEKLAVERAIREARQRAFAEARERAALERAAAEARQKNISDGREGLGKTTGQANDKTPAEKAAMEAKLKAERAAVERATAEARARALERALSEKAASEVRNKSDKSVAEQWFGASRDNGMKQSFHSKSFSYGVRDSTDVFDGANGDSAQRCKARSERHQRIGERVATALAEKNMRDRLVQKEQEERNRIAEALDADVRRWSSGKAGNLRALLSTLQYILGPDSGWHPIPLTDIVTTTAVKKAYRKATLFVHPDKLQQRGASIQQKYTCEKVFDLLKEAWNRFNMEER